MTRRRKPQPKPQGKAKRPAPAPEAAEADPLADARIRPFVERYCDLAGVKLLEKGSDLRELKLPPAERAHFQGRESVRLALSLDALERNPAAEIAVLGSPFLTHLIEAIRTRAGRLSLGMIPPPSPVAADDEDVAPSVAPPVPVRDGTARQSSVGLAAHPIGRLVARVVLRAGAAVEEAVVESDVFDLSTGTRSSDDVARLFQDLEARRVKAAAAGVIPAAAPVLPREPDEMLKLLLGNLREKSAERVAARQTVAEKEVATELDRLDRYFASILADKSDSEEERTITALHERRRTEEVRRHQVKAIVHPLQLVEAHVLVQRVEWELRSARGRRGKLAAQRPLAGTAAWTVACPHCGRPPSELVVCRHEEGHCACDACSTRCSVCAEDFCADHGIASCRIDEQPACAEHARVCPSCRMDHCSKHEGVCAEADHPACSACLEACGSCGRLVCNRHAQQSRPDAPKGSRRLCTTCVRYCEGGTNEPVGVDEVTQCASCSKSVCTAHQAVCVVDGHVHCSRHLHRTDASRRLVCGAHRADCAEEPAAIFASDEVEACPVCGKGACAQHRAACAHCGRQVCTADLDQQSHRCATCAQLATIGDPPEEVVTAARAVTGRAPKASRAWRIARDRSHFVVELDLGLTRKTVFTLRHGDTVPDRIVRHSVLGSKRRR
ncbi:MAG: hypothetical protein DMD38_01600 [Gemmatimonadetes bacterium]|nr:MAG: hypothetical protein DMD38_01600 [Gemmatimonadota bacterium]